MGKIVAVCISEVRGIQKKEVEEVYLEEGFGIEGDAHGGDWHRQVSLLGVESVAKAQEKCDFNIGNGAFAENILTEGIVLYELSIGTKLQIGEAEGEVTQIGKECHDAGCPIRKATGDCVMPKEGIFVKVTKSGFVRAGDSLKIKFDFGV